MGLKDLGDEPLPEIPNGGCTPLRVNPSHQDREHLKEDEREAGKISSRN